MLHMNIQEPYEGEAADREELLCPVCFHINDPEAGRCARCINPLGPCINLDPIGEIWTRGFLLLRAKHVPPSRLVLLGAWLLIPPCMLSLIPSWVFLPYWVLLILVPMGGWAAVLLFHITRNALRAAPDLDKPAAE